MENIKLSGALRQLSDPVSSTSSVKSSPQSNAPKSNDGAADTVKISTEGKQLSIDETSTPASTPKSNGYAIMLKRLFGIDDPNTPAPMETRVNSTTGMMGDKVFLTDSDRKVLATAYQYAADNNIAPVQVDNLAWDMGNYRFLSFSGGNVETKDGEQWNTDGSPRYMKMTDQDAKLAKQMLTSQAINATAMDHGFLAYELSPRGAGWTNSSNTGHASDFSFLQKFISFTSSTGANESADSTVPDANSASLPLAGPYANALNRINNQDKPLLPPPDWEAPEAKNSTTDKTVDSKNLEKTLNSLFPGGAVNSEQLQPLMALLGVHIKIQPDSHPQSFTSQNLSSGVMNLVNLLNASQINFSSNILSGIFKADANSSN
jgi:hypothetical protein